MKLPTTSAWMKRRSRIWDTSLCRIPFYRKIQNPRHKTRNELVSDILQKPLGRQLATEFFLFCQLNNFSGAGGELESLSAGIDEIRHLLVVHPPWNFSRSHVHEVFKVVSFIIIDRWIWNARSFLRLPGD